MPGDTFGVGCDPPSVVFGDIPIGETREASVVVRNMGSAPAELVGVESPPAAGPSVAVRSEPPPPAVGGEVLGKVTVVVSAYDDATLDSVCSVRVRFVGSESTLPLSVTARGVRPLCAHPARVGLPRQMKGRAEYVSRVPVRSVTGVGFKLSVAECPAFVTATPVGPGLAAVQHVEVESTRGGPSAGGTVFA